MQNLNNLLSVCNKYKQGEFDIEEFQSRITTSSIPENLSKEFLKLLVDFDNKIERIIFCIMPELREKQGHIVADELIQATLLEQERLKTMKP